MELKREIIEHLGVEATAGKQVAPDDNGWDTAWQLTGLPGRLRNRFVGS